MPQFDQRVGIFVDVQNMFYAAKHLYGSKLNFARLLEAIVRERRLVRSIAYVVQTPEIDQSNFLAMLRSNGYEIRSKELKQRPDGSAKGDWDMGLALDALALSDRLDVVAIVSGDGDFVELVQYLKARGVRVEVYSFPYSTAEELRNNATEYYQMGTEMVINPQPRPMNYNNTFGSYNPGFRRPFDNPTGQRAFGGGYNESGYGQGGYGPGGYNEGGYGEYAEGAPVGVGGEGEGEPEGEFEGEQPEGDLFPGNDR
jgi:uncharacterized LabA/DUF88 family protein